MNLQHGHRKALRIVAVALMLAGVPLILVIGWTGAYMVIGGGILHEVARTGKW